jgi:hypothetical protein
VRQIEGRAFQKVQRAVQNRVAAMETRPAARALSGLSLNEAAPC